MHSVVTDLRICLAAACVAVASVSCASQRAASGTCENPRGGPTLRLRVSALRDSLLGDSEATLVVAIRDVSGTPARLVGANVRLIRRDSVLASTYSDSAGIAVLTAVPRDYQVHIRAIGYVATERAVRLRAHFADTAFASLRQAPTCLFGGIR
jgi:hypothetical protein